MKKSVLPALAAIMLAAGCATQGQGNGVKAGDAGISFAEFEKLRDWRGVGSSGIYLESNAHKWYYATFTAPCTQLPTAVHIELSSVKIIAPTNFDSIKIYDERCFFKTFEETSQPPGA